MKALKYTVVVVLLVLAIIAAVAHYNRESIVRTGVNAAIGGLGITATELSVQSIGTRIVRLSALTLEQDGGTRYEIFDLAYPVSAAGVSESGAGARLIEIGQLLLTPAENDAAPTPPAPLLRTLLDLPDSVPNTEVTIGRLSAPGFPPAEDVVWRTAGPRQQLQLTLRVPATDATDAVAVDVTVDVDRADDEGHRAVVNATAGGDADAFVLQLDLRSSDTGITMAGDVTVSVSPWVPVLESIGLLPPDAIALDAELAGPVAIELGADGLLSDELGADGLLSDGQGSDGHQGPLARVPASRSRTN